MSEVAPQWTDGGLVQASGREQSRLGAGSRDPGPFRPFALSSCARTCGAPGVGSRSAEGSAVGGPLWVVTVLQQARGTLGRASPDCGQAWRKHE